jgi:hypothetical protein
MKIIENINYTTLFEDFKNGHKIIVYKPSDFNAPFILHLHHFDEKSNGDWSLINHPSADSAFTDAYIIREAIKRIDAIGENHAD